MKKVWYIVAVCDSCGSVALTSDGYDSVEVPSIAWLNDNGINYRCNDPLMRWCCCDACVNHWRVDYCCCGSGEPYDTCECGSKQSCFEEFIYEQCVQRLLVG